MHKAYFEQQTSGSYHAEDVTFLVKLIEAEELTAQEKEKALQSGEKHYSEMIAKEYCPTPDYLELFHRLVEVNGQKLADALTTLAYHMHINHPEEITIISLMRAGTPVGVLLKKILETRFEREVKHYSVSIVRDRGIDENALDFILDNEGRAPEHCLFVDGWTAKGVITKELKRYVALYNEKRDQTLSDQLYVLSDIGGTADVTASFDDYAIPSGILNSTVSGLISRSIWNDQIGENDFHGAKYYGDLEAHDMSNHFVNTILPMCLNNDIKDAQDDKESAKLHHANMMEYTVRLQVRFNENDINMIKPGIAEATRVMLRRIPRILIVRNTEDIDLQHLIQLAKDKDVPIEVDSTMPIRAVSLISNVSGD